eukprot:363634-Chlamydomonas_euryale.AAC.1
MASLGQPRQGLQLVSQAVRPGSTARRYSHALQAGSGPAHTAAGSRQPGLTCVSPKLAQSPACPAPCWPAAWRSAALFVQAS